MGANDALSDASAMLATTVVAYVALVVILRVSGKRTLAKLNAFDFVVTIALGSVLATTVLSDQVTAADGVVALVSLVALQFIVALVSVHFSAVNRAVKSTPTAVLVNGQLQHDAMDRSRVRADEVAVALRKHGASHFEDALAVVLETDGTLSVILARSSVGTRSTLEGVKGVAPR